MTIWQNRIYFLEFLKEIEVISKGQKSIFQK